VKYEGFAGGARQPRLGSLLARLCVLAGVDAGEAIEISSTGQLTVDQVEILVTLDDDGDYLKVFADVCEIEPDIRAGVYRNLLMGQGLRPVPFSVVPVIHTHSERLMALGFMPVPDSSDAADELLAFIKLVVLARHSLLQAVEKMRRL
jgi:hypothetical protein